VVLPPSPLLLLLLLFLAIPEGHGSLLVQPQPLHSAHFAL
jgi:hypothetical protein